MGGVGLTEKLNRLSYSMQQLNAIYKNAESLSSYDMNGKLKAAADGAQQARICLEYQYEVLADLVKRIEDYEHGRAQSPMSSL